MKYEEMGKAPEPRNQKRNEILIQPQTPDPALEQPVVSSLRIGQFMHDDQCQWNATREGLMRRTADPEDESERNSQGVVDRKQSVSGGSGASNGRSG